MRIVVLSLLVCTVFSAQIRPLKLISPIEQNLELSLSDIKDLLTGFALAFRVLEFVPEALDCLPVAQNFIPQVKDSIALIKKGGLENIVHGIQNLTSALHDVTATCGDAAIELGAFVKQIFTLFKNPDFIKNAKQALYVNAVIVQNDIVELLAAYKSKDYLSTGIRAGDIARIIVWGDANPQ